MGNEVSNETMRDARALADEYRPSMDLEVLHSWAAEAAARLRGEAARSPSYDALLIIAQSVCGALERAGITDADDPGEAIDVMRERYESRIAELAAKGEQQAVAEYQVRLVNVKTRKVDADGYDWHRCTREEYEQGPCQGTHFAVEYRTLYTRPQPAAPAPVAGDAVRIAAQRLIETLSVDSFVKSSTKNANAGFVDMRCWYAMQGEVAALKSALAQDRASQAAAPSAPVGVERKYPDDGNGDDDAYNRGWNDCLDALAQQPASADGAMDEYLRGYKDGHTAATEYCVGLTKERHNA